MRHPQNAAGPEPGRLSTPLPRFVDVSVVSGDALPSLTFGHPADGVAIWAAGAGRASLARALARDHGASALSCRLPAMSRAVPRWVIPRLGASSASTRWRNDRSAENA